jgi:uncharacterized protein GlcG (DUF336 family)
MSLTYEQAHRALEAAVSKAAEIGSPSSIAVLDAGRELMAFARHERALLASVEISQGKAYAACSMQMPSGELGPLSQPGAPFFGLETTQRRPFVTFGGGQPLQIGGEFAGAVGVAGGTIDQDEEVAAAAVSSVAGT